jgi:hypothetical protein
MHRMMDGTKFTTKAELDAARQRWIAEGKSPTTYCGRKEYADYVEDLGVLVFKFKDDNGTVRELRKHASIKSEARGGSPAIRHNRVIESNHLGGWTYYPASEPGDLIRTREAQKVS